MPYIQTRDKQQIFIRDIGRQSKPENPPIILLHGFGMQSVHWLPFVLPLSRKHRFIIPDFRGFGRSHTISHNRDCVISNYADDLADIIEQLDLKQFKLAGISMGAFVALQYQDTYGEESVNSYLHIDQSPRCINRHDWSWGLFGQDNEPRLSRATELLELLTPHIEMGTPYQALPKHLKIQLWTDLGDFFASALSKPLHKMLAKKLCGNEAVIRRVMPVNNWPVYIRCLKAYIEQDYNMLATLQKLEKPISLLVGLKSEMYPCGGQLRIADHHRNCKVIPFANSGHTPLIDQPIRFLKELMHFATA
jgi:pimeloyl-ACP methyl ester carboxylesterase